jgi:hypothetical protein
MPALVVTGLETKAKNQHWNIATPQYEKYIKGLDSQI